MRSWLVAITATLMLNPLVAPPNDTSTPSASQIPSENTQNPASQAQHIIRAQQLPSTAFIFGQYLLALVLVTDAGGATAITATHGHTLTGMRPNKKLRGLSKLMARALPGPSRGTGPGPGLLTRCDPASLTALHTPVDARLQYRGPPPLR